MLKLNISGREPIQVEHLVLDYNGTLAVDGKIIPGVKERLNILASKMSIHVITANTFGEVQQNLTGIDCECTVIGDIDQQVIKDEFVSLLGAANVVAIGNGFNDNLMLKSAAIGIAIVQSEGASAKALLHADVVCSSINDALDLLINPLRISATLRN